MGEMRLMSALGCKKVLDQDLVDELESMGTKFTSGDTKVMWNPDNGAEVKSAKRTWDDLVGKKGFRGFRVKRDGEPGEQVSEFDATAGKLIIVPPMAGGT